MDDLLLATSLVRSSATRRWVEMTSEAASEERGPITRRTRVPRPGQPALGARAEGAGESWPCCSLKPRPKRPRFCFVLSLCRTTVSGLILEEACLAVHGLPGRAHNYGTASSGLTLTEARSANELQSGGLVGHRIRDRGTMTRHGVGSTARENRRASVVNGFHHDHRRVARAFDSLKKLARNLWLRRCKPRRRLDIGWKEARMCAECPDNRDNLHTCMENPISSAYFYSPSRRADTSPPHRPKLQAIHASVFPTTCVLVSSRELRKASIGSRSTHPRPLRISTWPSSALGLLRLFPMKAHSPSMVFPTSCQRRSI